MKFAVEHKSWLRAYWHDHESQKTNFTRNGVVIGQCWDGPVIDLAKDALGRDNRLFSKKEWKAASKKILGEDPLNL